MRARSSSIKTFLANVLLSLAALAVAFGIGEIAVRVLYKDASVLFPRYHTDYQYGRYTLRGIRPNAEFWHTSVDGSWKFVTNSKGFRDTREIPYAKPAGTLRVLTLGDSHTQGYEVHQEQTYAAVAERFLTGRKIAAQAINAGVSGFSTAEALAFLESEGHKYGPDAVVLGFYANDFEDNLKAGLFVLDGAGKLAERKYQHIPGVRIQNAIYAIAPVRWLSENSYFYSLLFNGVWEYFKNRLLRQAIAQTEHAVPTGDGPGEPEIALAAALIERMQRFCAERGIRLVVVDIPTRPAPHRFASSLPPAFLAKLEAAGVEVLSSARMLADFDGAGALHVAHGHQHISELTHTLIGVELGRRFAAK